MRGTRSDRPALKILVLTEYFPTGENEGITGGVESRAIALLRELARTHDVTVLCSWQGAPQPRRDRVAGIDVWRVGPEHPYSNEGHVATRLAYAVAALRACLRGPRFDIVEGFSYVTYPVAALVGRLRRTPSVATFHESWSLREWVRLKGAVTGGLGAAWNRIALAIGFDRYVAVSEATRRQLVAQGVDGRTIVVVHNGVDLDVMRSVEACFAPEAGPSVSTSVRLIASKRADVLIRAIAEVSRRVPDVSLTIHGEGVEEDALRALVDELGIGGRVAFVGRIASFRDVLALRRRHQVFCLPSISEGFGMVAIEAMALGVPVVCTDIPVLREITGADREATALLFRPDDPRDLAEKLGLLLSDPALREQLARRGCAHAEAFSWTKLALEVEGVYGEAIRGR